MATIQKLRNYLSKEKCKEAAIKYKTRSAFKKNNASAYAKARKNRWLEEICFHMKLLQLPNGYWTKEKCKEEALKYKTRSEFDKKNATAYNKASKYGWLNEICPHMVQIQHPANYWTKEICRKEAQKYKTRGEFQDNSGSAYSKASKNRWLNEICSHMISVKKANDYWTKKRCHEEALKYKTRGEFQKKSGSANNKAKQHGWHDEICSHMVRVGNRSSKLIYAYEFSDNTVYIGLTYNINDRQKHRDQDEGDAVTKHKTKTGLKPIRKLLTDYIPVEEAIKEENAYIKKYLDNGWIILNKSKAGSIGGNVVKWTKEELQKEALKYISRVEFQKKKPGAYSSGRTKGWIKEICSHMPLLQIPNGSLTKEVCRKVALKYKTRTEFARDSAGAYDKAWKNDWLDDICSHMTSVQKPYNYWTKERCHEEAIKYKTRSEFQKNSVTAYDKVLLNDWFNEMCSHMRLAKLPNGHWKNDKELCRNEALKYNSSSEFARKSSGAYKAAQMNGWLSEICSHMKSIKNKKM